MKKVPVTAAISASREERIIAELVQLANQFKSEIHIETENKIINAKSIMGMMTLQLVSGVSLEVSADGADEEQAIKSLTDYLEGK